MKKIRVDGSWRRPRGKGNISKNVDFSLGGKQCIVLPKWNFFRVLAHCAACWPMTNNGDIFLWMRNWTESWWTFYQFLHLVLIFFFLLLFQQRSLLFFFLLQTWIFGHTIYQPRLSCNRFDYTLKGPDRVVLLKQNHWK